MSRLIVSIVTPTKRAIEAQADIVIAPSAAGESAYCRSTAPCWPSSKRAW